MIGHKNIEKIFVKLIKENKLSHGYIFFGEPQVGKFTFAKNLANLIEAGKFAESEKPLQELTLVMPANQESQSIGIDEIRSLKNFLYQKPINSTLRIAIVDNAHLLTDHAQNAILKISEEPPEHGLIIMIVSNPEVLLETLRSRFQRIYFPRIRTDEIEKMLVEKGESEKEANKIARLAFGRPGRAIDLINSEKFAEVDKLAKRYLSGKIAKKNLIDTISGSDARVKPELFLETLIAELMVDTKGNIEKIKSATERLKTMSQFNTNKRMQLESALI